MPIGCLDRKSPNDHLEGLEGGPIVVAEEVGQLPPSHELVCKLLCPAAAGLGSVPGHLEGADHPKVVIR